MRRDKTRTSKDNGMMRHIAGVIIGLSVAALHTTICYLLLGKTATIVIVAIQLLIAAWMIYELIRAPTYDD